MGSSSFGSSLVLRTFEVNYILHLKLSGTSTTHSFVFFVASGKLCLSSAALVFSDTDLVGTEEHLPQEQTRPGNGRHGDFQSGISESDQEGREASVSH